MKINTSRGTSASTRKSSKPTKPSGGVRLKSGSTTSKAISVAKARGLFDSSETFEETRAVISPTAEGKKLEMAARLAIDVARLCAAWTEYQGDHVLASCRPPRNGEGVDHIKRLVQAIADPPYAMGAPRLGRNKAGNMQWYGGGNHARWLWDHDMWDTVYTYWRNGGHDRNLKRLMDQMPDKNRQAVRKYLDKRKR